MPRKRKGVIAPAVTTGSVDPVKANVASKLERQERVAMVSAGGNRARTAGTMLGMGFGSETPFLGQTTLPSYFTSYANGMNMVGGLRDIPPYFVMMNEQNGGILYWPVTLREKYEWYRYWQRCIFLHNFTGLVLMGDGTLKSIKDVKIGDEVITGFGTTKKVKNKFERRCIEDKAVTIKAWCLQNPIQTTHHHPFYILRENQVKFNKTKYNDEIKFEPQWVHAENIKEGDYVLFAPLNNNNPSDITPDQARFLGYYASEGSLMWGQRCEGTKDGKGWRKGNKKIDVPVQVAFTLNSSERYTMAEKIKELTKKVFNRDNFNMIEDETSIEIRIAGREVGEFCLKHVGEYSHLKRLSKELLFASIESRKEFLMAYFEGDGHQYPDCDTNSGKLMSCTASPYLPSQIQTMAISAGIMCRIAKYKRSAKDMKRWNSKEEIWHISIPTWSANSFCDELSCKWASIDKTTQKHCALFINGYAAFKVRKIKYTEEDDTVYNIEVDAEGDEKSFICNGMVTHNTDAYCGRAIELLSDLPMSKITLNMPKMEGVPREKKKEIHDFYTGMCDKLNLFTKLTEALLEYNVIGNCLPASHLIHTPFGMLPISEIREGDLVLNDKGSYSKVTTIARRYVNERLVKLNIAKLYAMNITPTVEHPIFVLRNNEEELVKSKDVRVGDYIGIAYSNITKDIDEKDVAQDLPKILKNKYEQIDTKCENNQFTANIKYACKKGTSDTTSFIKDSIMKWLGEITEPTSMTCLELCKKLNLTNHVQMRTVAYSLRRNGVIKTKRIGVGQLGSSIMWYPLDHNKSYKDFYCGRTFEKTLSTNLLSFNIDKDFLYLLGYWLGDGWLWKYDHSHVQNYLAFDICVDPNAIKFIEKLNSVMNSVFKGHFEQGKNIIFKYEHMHHFIVEDALICDWWGHNFGDNCFSKKLPQWITELPSEKLIWLLRGLVDSDGCTNHTATGTNANISLRNKKLIDQIFQIGIKCGIPFSYNEKIDSKNSKPSRTNVSYTLNISDKKKVYNLINGCVKELDNNSNMDTIEPEREYIEKDGKFYYKVNSIDEPYYEGYVYNFEVENEHTYCTNHIRTHNCFLFAEWNKDRKMWDRIVILPPEEIAIFQYPFSDMARVEYRPERLIGLIKMLDSTPMETLDDLHKNIIKDIPQELIEMIKKEGCIVMDTDPSTGSFVHQLARRKPPYMDLGASVLERVLVPMLMKEHFRYTQLGLASRNMTPKNKISAPSLNSGELDDLRLQIDLSFMDPEYSVITNYEWQWDLIGADARLLDLQAEYEMIENHIFAGLGVTRELLTGEGTYSGNRITVEILNTMFLLTREILQNYVEKQLFRPVAEAHHWYHEDKNGMKQYWYPKVGFNRLTIRDNQEVFDSLFQLYQKGSLPIDIIYELFNLNTEDIHDRIYNDLFTVKDSTFNRVLEEVSTEVGRNLPEKSDITKRVMNYLRLEAAPPPPQEGAPPQPEEEPSPEDIGKPPMLQNDMEEKGKVSEEDKNVDEIADLIADKLRGDESHSEIADVVDKILPTKTEENNLEEAEEKPEEEPKESEEEKSEEKLTEEKPEDKRADEIAEKIKNQMTGDESHKDIADAVEKALSKKEEKPESEKEEEPEKEESEEKSK